MGSEGLLGVGSQGGRECRAQINSSWILCRLTMAVTLSMAVFAPTTQGLCIVCALCRPGELPDQGWGMGRPSGQLVTVVLTRSHPT